MKENKFEQPSEYESGKNNDFFNWDEMDVTNKYSTTVAELEASGVVFPSGTPKDRLDFNVFKIIDEASRRLNLLIEDNNWELSDEFFGRIERLAYLYKNSLLEQGHPYHDSKTAVQYAQLGALIRSPRFLKDSRITLVFEILSDLHFNQSPITHHMFMDYIVDPDDELRGKYILKKGFGIEQIPTFEKLIDNPQLWKEDCVPLFSSITEALEKISGDYPDYTLQPRLKLLKNNLDTLQEASINYKLVYSFETSQDQVALRNLITDNPDSELVKLAQKILSGGFDKTRWAI